MTRTDIARLRALDEAHVIHPHRPVTHPGTVIIDRGAGCLIWDVEGREYLDATAGLAVTHVGHAHPALVAAATEQLGRLEYYPSFWEYGNPRAIELAARLAALAPTGPGKVFFTSGGSEGIEAALRMARFYHHEGGEPGRTVVLARTSAYHGVGYGSGSLTGFADYHVGFAPMLPDVRHLTPPWSYRRELFDGADPTDFCVRELERVIAEVGPGRIAAFVGEPVMGVAGMVTPPADYWPRIVDVLRANGILFVADEVICAYGRTGHWFATERYGVTPDITVTAKGLTSGYVPLGAVLVSTEVAARLDRGPDGFPIGYTYSGHPTACAVAMANLDVIERDGLVERSASLGARLLDDLSALADRSAVGEVRGAGLMLGLELVRDTPAGPDIGANVSRYIRAKHGVIIRNHDNVLSISPPLVVTDEQADRIVDAVRDALDRLDPDGTVS
ncbi:aminotransferase family protein [Virgisporangium aurantiacum]|uniref:Aspartate aminotransferase family protein n=1 Tax=Virgisporangium aurantiacum TaxID=175570 RepID=A0A8J4E0F7_9ACTN|nr:aspartate aminotransferase family protein [Virgisporangium aurantiacum]GIJ56934.1 aspartate aminotransferase family protein [Virgisporangium aurantiacum]